MKGLALRYTLYVIYNMHRKYSAVLLPYVHVCARNAYQEKWEAKISFDNM